MEACAPSSSSASPFTFNPSMASTISGDNRTTNSRGAVNKITSKFNWDKKTIFWEIENISEAVGRVNVRETGSRSPNHQAVQEFHSLLDIDYINCYHFEAGNHPENNSVWSLSLYKQSNPEYLGLFIHLLEIEADSAVNRRFHHNNTYDEYDTHGLYMKYNMSVVSPTGNVLHKIDNTTVINIMSGNSWGEDQFISIESLWDPNSHYITDDKLRIKVDLWLFQQLSHNISTLDQVPYSLQETQNLPPVAKNTEDLSRQENKVLASLWQTRGFSDVQIQCDGRCFSVHKCVISAASPVFEAMFTNDMTEASENQVKIIDTDPDVLEAMLEFLYTSTVSQPWNWDNIDKVSGLLNACEKYQVKDLKELCLKMLCDRLTIINAGETAILLHLYNAQEYVKGFVYSFIARNLKVLKQRKEFVQLVDTHPAAFTPILLSNAISDLI